MKEQLIAEWTEPTRKRGGVRQVLTLTLLTVGSASLLVSLGIQGYGGEYYLAAVAFSILGLATLMQSRRPSQPLTVSVTNQQIIVGRKSYPLESLAGFWMSTGKQLVINLEQKSPSMFPISFSYPDQAQAEARAIFSGVLPEIEARSPTVLDQIARYFEL
jgi:hypothetical protein